MVVDMLKINHWTVVVLGVGLFAVDIIAKEVDAGIGFVEFTVSIVGVVANQTDFVVEVIGQPITKMVATEVVSAIVERVIAIHNIEAIEVVTMSTIEAEVGPMSIGLVEAVRATEVGVVTKVHIQIDFAEFEVVASKLTTKFILAVDKLVIAVECRNLRESHLLEGQS